MTRLTTLSILISLHLVVSFIHRSNCASTEMTSLSTEATSLSTEATSLPTEATSLSTEATSLSTDQSAQNVTSDPQGLNVSVSPLPKKLRCYFITDLNVTVDESTNIMVINWTNCWVGKEVTNLTLHFHANRTYSRNNTIWDNSQILKVVEDKKRGKEERYNFDLMELNIETVYFTVAVRVEHVNGESEVSLPVIVYLKQLPTATTLTTTTILPTTISIESGNNSTNSTTEISIPSTTPGKSSSLQATQLSLIFAFASVFFRIVMS